MADASVVFTTDLDSSGLKSGLSRLKSSIGMFAKTAGIAIGAVATGLGVLAKSALSYNSQMEQYYTSFTTLLGSEEKAAAKVAELKTFAAKTPFEMTDLANATKTILGFGVAEDKASVAMKQLGDISQGNSERFSSLALVYGQMASTGKLMGQDLLQMINAGFNPLTVIAEQTGTSIGELKKVMSGEKTSKEFNAAVKAAQKEVKALGTDASLSAKILAEIGSSGEISASLVDEAMRIATSEGGLFYQAMEKQSKTAAGLISTLKDNSKALLGEVFTGTSEAMKQQALPAALGYIDQLTIAFRSGGTPALMSAFGDILGDVVSQASAYAPQLVKLSIGLISSFLTGIQKNAPVIAKGLAATFKAAVQGLITIAPDLIGVGLELLLALADSLADELPEIMTSLMDTVFTVMVKLVSNVPRLVQAGAKIMEALVLGMIRALGTLLGDFWGLFTAYTNEKLENAIDAVKVNLKPNITEEQQQAITDAINAGIKAADKVFEIQASVDTDIDDFTAELDTAFADDKFTKKELTNLQSTLNGQVDDAIAAATEHIAVKREEYKSTLLTLVDDNGQPIYTEAAAETLSAAMSEKTTQLTAELDQARTDLNTLLSTIYATKSDPTQEQLDNINALLEQIGVLEVKLGTLQDQAVQVATAKTERVKRGEGTTEDFGVALGFTGELYRQQTAAIEADTDARLAALQAVAEADGATQDTIDAAYSQMDTLYSDAALAHQTAAETYNTDMLALYNGMAEKYPDAAKTISNISDLSGTLNEVSALTTTLNTMNEFDPTQLSSFMDSFSAMYTDFYGMDIPAGDMDRLLDPFTFAGAASELLSTFNDDIAGLIESNAAGLDDNPLMLYLQTMLESGSFDNLDVTKVDGALEDALKLIDFVARGEDAGTQLVDGVNGGIGYAADNLSDDDIIKLRDAILENMRTVFGIHSPAKSMQPIGEAITAGVVQAMTARLSDLSAASAMLLTAVMKGTNAFANGRIIGSQMISGMIAAITAGTAALVSAVAVAVSQAMKTGQGLLSSTLLSRVQSYTGTGIPSMAGLSNALLRGSQTTGAGAVIHNASNRTLQFNQNITFESTMQAPDEIAKALRRQSAHGLEGAKA